MSIYCSTLVLFGTCLAVCNIAACLAHSCIQICLLADSCTDIQRWWRRLVDDFGCALFGPVLFVTLSFYGLQFLPLDRLYGDDYQVVCVASSALYLLCLLFVCSSCPLLPTRTGFQKSAYAATACSPCVDVICLCHILLLRCLLHCWLICSLYQEYVLTRIGFSQANALHQQQPACYSEDICVSPLTAS